MSAAVAPLGAPAVPAAAAAVAPASAPDPGVLSPIRIEVPAIAVDAPVDPLGVTDSGELQVPADYQRVGWWADGASPGAPGPAVLVGHLDSTSGPAVFFKLDKLKIGDRIFVHREDGSASEFTVTKRESYAKDRFPTLDVYGSTEGPTLRLVTCYGSFDRRTRHYRDNLVVYASPSP
ncbi:MAG: class F sortase [Actinobacteria bacterium]|nr:class F sortase [Actinomycetota bacterium]